MDIIENLFIFSFLFPFLLKIQMETNYLFYLTFLYAFK